MHGSHTVSRVIHPMARRASRGSPQPTVNNSAATKISRSGHTGSGRAAPGRSRSYGSSLTKASLSAPAGLVALVPKSERTKAHEAPCMRSTRDQTAVQASIVRTMKIWNELKHYAGLDCAKDHHDVVLVDPEGTIVAEFGFEHSAKGWEKLRQSIKPFPHLGVVLETNHGIVVDQLLEAGCLVFAIHPKSAKHYRDRKIPSGNKTDRTDAWTMAEALRTDGRASNPVNLEDEATQQIRLLCRDEITLIDQRTLLVNQLQQALRDYFPAALEAFDDWTLESTWDFVIQFPTPQALALAGKRRWEKFLHTHRMWRGGNMARRRGAFFRRGWVLGSASAGARAESPGAGAAHNLTTRH